MYPDPRQRSWGFTLLELALTMTLIALVAAIAFPSLTGYVDRSRVSRAVGDIGSLSLQIARWELSFGNRADTLAEMGLDGRLDPFIKAFLLWQPN